MYWLYFYDNIVLVFNRTTKSEARVSLLILEKGKRKLKNKSTQERAIEIIKPIAEELGYYLVEVQYIKEHTGMVLAVCIDKPGGVNINDCEALSRALDAPLDENDITYGASYNLNVSSYGLDRSLKTDYDFNKFKNELIEIKFYKPFFGKKMIIAKLIDFDAEKLVIEVEDKKEEILRKEMANIVPHIEF